MHRCLGNWSLINSGHTLPLLGINLVDFVQDFSPADVEDAEEVHDDNLDEVEEGDDSTDDHREESWKLMNLMVMITITCNHCHLIPSTYG